MSTMTRRSHVRSVTLYRMQGQGPTRTAANGNAIQRLTQATIGHYRPWYCLIPDRALIVWRELDGWTYAIVYPDCARTGQPLGTNPVTDEPLRKRTACSTAEMSCVRLSRASQR